MDYGAASFLNLLGYVAPLCESALMCVEKKEESFITKTKVKTAVTTDRSHSSRQSARNHCGKSPARSEAWRPPLCRKPTSSFGE